MPTSKQARARQARQKQRVAELHAAREQKRRRNRRIGAGAAALVLILGVVLAVAAATTGGGSSSAAPTTTTTPPTTTAPLKRCVGLKEPLPAGAPAIPIKAGAAAPKLTTKEVTVGTGAVVPKNAPSVTVNYVGIACTTGKVFDSSYKTGKPFTANLDPNAPPNQRVIAGWQQGIPGMKVGGVRLLEIPADLAYGASGQPPAIGPDEPLFFIVSVVKVQPDRARSWLRDWGRRRSAKKSPSTSIIT